VSKYSEITESKPINGMTFSLAKWDHLRVMSGRGYIHVGRKPTNGALWLESFRAEANRTGMRVEEWQGDLYVTCIDYQAEESPATGAGTERKD
jgi:hypothetical protein